MNLASSQPARRAQPGADQPEQGLAALTVVMVLFFIMAMVAAYTNRNLIFEQRASANSYRAERALMAADAGTEWALTLLNSGRVNGACLPSVSPADVPMRQRLLLRNLDDGSYLPVVLSPIQPPYASCINSGATLTCVCPTIAVPNPVPHAVKDWPVNGGGTAFRVALVPASGGPRPGVLSADVRGCATPGSGDDSCAAGTLKPLVDATARVRAALGLVRALPVPPPAALTAGRNISASTAALRISNPDSASALTVHAGGVVNEGPGSQLLGPAGSGDSGRVAGDAAMAALVPATPAARFTTGDLFFRALFGMEAPTYRQQPAVVRFDCSGGGCSMADLESALVRYAGLTLWFDGDLLLDNPPGAALGDAINPAMLIVTGQLRLSVAASITGFVYARDVAWTAGAANASVRGAVVALNDFVADVPAILVYDVDVLKTIQLFFGSFVRVPGGWNRPT